MAGNIVDALFYLRSRSLVNLVASRLRRLKQPKYVAGGIIGIAYLYFVFVRRPGPPRPPGAAPLPGIEDASAIAPALAAVGLFVFFALCWVLRRERAALGFTEAEIAFLFPAPATRRALVHYRILSIGLAGIFSSLLLGAVSARWNFMTGGFAIRAAGLWLVFTALALHTLASAFTLTRLLDRGWSAARTQLLGIAGVALLLAPPLLWLRAGLTAGTTTWTSAMEHGPVAWLLWPFRMLAAPMLATDGHAWLVAAGPALAILALHYFWLLQMQVSFEEASIARAGKRAARLAAMRAGNYRMGAGTQKARRPPFDLGRMRRPELAFLWKNLLSTASYLRLRNALVAAAVIVGGCLWLERSEFFQSMRPALGMVALVMMVYTLVFGPQLARQDFRSDLPNTDILKTYPLRGWQVMLGEMLTPAAILTGLLWLMLLAAAMLFVAPPRMGPIAPGLRTGVTLGLALLAPLLCLAQLLIVNAFAVLFPAWQPAAGQSQQGIEVMGQRILFVAAQMLAMVLSLVPAIVVGGVVFAALRWMAGPVAGGVAGLLVGAGVMVVELGLAIAWLGARFEALDLSQELRP